MSNIYNIHNSNVVINNQIKNDKVVSSALSSDQQSPQYNLSDDIVDTAVYAASTIGKVGKGLLGAMFNPVGFSSSSNKPSFTREEFAAIKASHQQAKITKSSDGTSIIDVVARRK